MSKSNGTCSGCLGIFIILGIIGFLLDHKVGVMIIILIIVLIYGIVQFVKYLKWKLLPEEKKIQILKRGSDISYVCETIINFFQSDYNMPIELKKTVIYNVTEEGETIEYWLCANKIYFSPSGYFKDYICRQVKFNCGTNLNISELVDENIEMAIEILKRSFEKQIIVINKKDIQYFKITGEILHNITGGGSDLGGAIVGGVLAGGAGAVIGSRKEINTEFIDNKRTILVYKVNGNVKQLEFDKNFYNKLLSWIPEKNYDYIVLNPNENKSKNHKEDIISDEELKELEVINKIKNKYNINNPETAKSILDKCNNVFKTDIGIDFINELKRNSEHL